MISGYYAPNLYYLGGYAQRKAPMRISHVTLVTTLLALAPISAYALPTMFQHADTMSVSLDIPAAQGKVKFGKADNGNTSIDLMVKVPGGAPEAATPRGHLRGVGESGPGFAGAESRRPHGGRSLSAFISCWPPPRADLHRVGQLDQERDFKGPRRRQGVMVSSTTQGDPVAEVLKENLWPRSLKITIFVLAMAQKNCSCFLNCYPGGASINGYLCMFYP